jgi:hypothetical protein
MWEVRIDGESAEELSTPLTFFFELFPVERD